MLWDKLVLKLSGYRGGIQLTNLGVHAIIYFAYDAYSVNSAAYADTIISRSDSFGELIIRQRIDGEDKTIRGQFGKAAGDVIQAFERHKVMFASRG